MPQQDRQQTHQVQPDVDQEVSARAGGPSNTARQQDLGLGAVVDSQPGPGADTPQGRAQELHRGLVAPLFGGAVPNALAPLEGLDESGILDVERSYERLYAVGLWDDVALFAGAAVRGHAFLSGVIEGLSSSASAGDLVLATGQLGRAMLVSGAYPVWLVEGALVGVMGAIADLVGLLQCLPETLAAVKALAEALVSPSGPELARALGVGVGQAVGGEAKALGKLDTEGACRWLGERVGPLVLEALAWLLGVGPVSAARRVVVEVGDLAEDVADLAPLRRALAGTAAGIARAEVHAAQALNFDWLKATVIGRAPPPVAPRGYVYRFDRDVEPPALQSIARKQADDLASAKLTLDAEGRIQFGGPSRARPDVLSRYVRDPETGAPVKLDVGGAGVADEVAEPLLGQRSAAVGERDRLRSAGDKVGAGKAQGRANRATEQLGVEGAQAAVEALYPGAEKVFEGRGAGTFDLIYRPAKPPPEFVVVEAKGGRGGNSASRRVGDQQVQQGHRDYAESVLDAMEKRQVIDESLAGELHDTLAFGELEYLEIRQPIAKSGGLGKLAVRQYDLALKEGLP